jgi:hypothetical protein
MSAIDKKGKDMGISFGEDFREKRAMMTDLLLTGSLNAPYLEQLAKQMDDINVLDEKFAAQSKTAAANLEFFKSSVNRLGISLGNLLIPALNKAMGIIEPIVDGIASFAKEHKTLSKIILTSIGGFGLLAVTVGTLSFAVGTVTKSFVLMKTATKAYNFLNGFSAVKTGLLNEALLATPAAARGAEAAMTGFGASLGRTLIVATALYYTLKGISYLEEKRAEKKAWINKHMPQDMKAKYGRISWINGREMEHTKNGYANSTINENVPEADARKIDSVYKLYDSTMNFIDKRNEFLKQKADSAYDAQQQSEYHRIITEDSTRNAADTAGSAPFYGGMHSEPGPGMSSAKGSDHTEHKVVVEINNNSGYQVNASSSDSAVAVVVKTKSTFNRTKTGLS